MAPRGAQVLETRVTPSDLRVSASQESSLSSGTYGGAWISTLRPLMERVALCWIFIGLASFGLGFAHRPRRFGMHWRRLWQGYRRWRVVVLGLVGPRAVGELRRRRPGNGQCVGQR